MSTRTHTTTVSAEWGCDATGCKARIRAEFDENETVSEFAADDVIAIEALKRGWTRWSGRFVRHYCWDHGPKPGHKMEDNSAEFLQTLLEDQERNRVLGKEPIYAQVETIFPRS